MKSVAELNGHEDKLRENRSNGNVKVDKRNIREPLVYYN